MGQNWVRKSRFVLTTLEMSGWTKLRKDHDVRLKWFLHGISRDSDLHPGKADMVVT